MLWHYALFIIFGLFGLWLGAELVVRGALEIAKKLGLSETFVGLTILAIGTDFPEIMIAITGAINQLHGQETSGLIVGNFLGSNLVNVTFILGLAGLFKVLKLRKRETLQSGFMMIFTACVLFILSLDGFISVLDSLMLMALYVFYFLTLNKNSKLDLLKTKATTKKNAKKTNLIFPSLQLIFGLITLIQASQLVLDNSLLLATELHVSQFLIGILIVGVGTSLPELIVSLKAALSGSDGLSVGNLIGSNIINISLALGASAMLGGWHIDRAIVMFDLPYLLLVSVIVVLFLLTRRLLERKESILLIVLYVIYVALKLIGW